MIPIQILLHASHNKIMPFFFHIIINMNRIINCVQHFMGIIIRKAKSCSRIFIFIKRYNRILQAPCFSNNRYRTIT